MDPNTLASNNLNTNNINNTIQQLISTAGNTSNVPIPTIPTLKYTPPSGQDLNSQYLQFLNQAASDPNLVSYYQNLMTQAQGDYTVATQLLNQDYTTGVRQTTDNLNNALQQLGLTFNQEQNSTQNSLNQRGIALTQNPDGTLSYGTQGESGTELGQLNQSEQLRSEAQQRSAQQTIENLGITQQKGLVSAGQSLQSSAQNLAQQQQSDVANRANESMNIYQAQQQSNLQQAEMNQQNQYNSQGGSSSGGSNWSSVFASQYPGWNQTAAQADYKSKNPGETLF